ncbi:protein TsetseEP-like [Schistocerca gregaria]|uniref:protein TsetseEP-like n=1 Tax=Schistocerca gregaria TaxID=7010 RepID=UPI00211E43D8|nr:protein TsetseEP-like [Schistocerca gregaria]
MGNGRFAAGDADDVLLRPPFRPAPRTAPPDDADQVVPASPRPARDATVPFCYGGRLPASIYYATGTRVTRPQCAAGLVLPDILNDVAGASPSPPAPDAESESEPDVETDAEAPELGVGRDVVTGILYNIVRQSTSGQSSHQSPTEDTAMEAEEPAETEEQPTEPEDRPTDPEDRQVEPEEEPTEPKERPSELEEGPAEAEDGPVEAEMEDPMPLSPSPAAGAEGAGAVPEEEPVSVMLSEKEDREQETETETEEGAAQSNAEEVVRGVAEEDSTGMPDCSVLVATSMLVL